MDEKTKEIIYLILYCTLPALILWPVRDYLAEPGTYRILFGVLLFVLSITLGIGLYFLTKKKSTKTKNIVLTIVLVLGLMTLGIVRISLNEIMKTCEICGYKAIDNKQEKECNVCGTETWKFQTYYDTKLEWRRREQLYWFAEDDTSSVDFYNPKIIHGFNYQKDASWKPAINKFEIVEYNKEK